MQRTNFYTQGQQSLVSLLLTVWLMVGSNLNITLAAFGSGPIFTTKPSLPSKSKRSFSRTTWPIGALNYGANVFHL